MTDKISQIIDYWTRGNETPKFKYVREHKHIIAGLLKRKWKLNNETLIVSLLGGHYVNWVDMYKDNPS